MMSQELLSSKNAWNISIGCVTLVLQAILECVSILFVFRSRSDEWYLKQSLKMFNVRKHSQYCCHLLSTPLPLSVWSKAELSNGTTDLHTSAR